MHRSVLLLAIALPLAWAAPAIAQTTAAAATAQPARQLFLFLFRPGPAWRAGVPMREQDLRAHAAYHAQLLREGRSFAGGGYIGMDGGLAIVRAVDRAEAEAMLAADPAILNGVFAAEIREWRPRFHNEAPLVERAR
jgi:uncharacterized protein YciI